MRANRFPPNTLIDGEIILANAEGASDFGALQRRLGGKRDDRRDGNPWPAVLLCFDVAILGGQDLTACALGHRRGCLEALLAGLHPCLQLISQTDDHKLAHEWLTLVPSIEGVVAKRTDSQYTPGRREWVKVKRQNTVDCVVIGLTRDPASPSLVLGLRHHDGELHHFGVARHSAAVFGDPCAPTFEVVADEKPIRSRWQHDAVPAWRRVAPSAVVEVAYTTLDGRRWLRQPARFVRWRPDRSVDGCGLEQLVDR
jgi:ATP-dependent DNA ligase